MDLKVDDSRVEAVPHTGIYVRAWSNEEKHHGSYDIAELDAESLLVWLRSRGGNNPWAEDVVGILLGHGPLHELVRAGQGP